LDVMMAWHGPCLPSSWDEFAGDVGEMVRRKVRWILALLYSLILYRQGTLHDTGDRIRLCCERNVE
jgi:hypothetical protein